MSFQASGYRTDCSLPLTLPHMFVWLLVSMCQAGVDGHCGAAPTGGKRANTGTAGDPGVVPDCPEAAGWWSLGHSDALGVAVAPYFPLMFSLFLALMLSLALMLMTSSLRRRRQSMRCMPTPSGYRQTLPVLRRRSTRYVCGESRPLVYIHR